MNIFKRDTLSITAIIVFFTVAVVMVIVLCGCCVCPQTNAHKPPMGPPTYLRENHPIRSNCWPKNYPASGILECDPW